MGGGIAIGIGGPGSGKRAPDGGNASQNLEEVFQSAKIETTKVYLQEDAERLLRLRLRRVHVSLCPFLVVAAQGRQHQLRFGSQALDGNHPLDNILACKTRQPE